MKKLTTLFLAAAMVAAASAPASAVDVKMDGRYQFQFQTGSEGFTGQNTDYTQQRLRVGMTFTASEELSGYFQLQAGTYDWGTQNGPNGDVFMRQAYIDWTVPNTDVRIRMGRHAFDLPSYASTSSMIADLVADGVVVSAPLGDNYEVTGFWTRASRGSHDGDVANVSAPKYELFGLVGNASFERLTFSPWVLYGSKGHEMTVDNTELLTSQGNLTGLGHADLYIIGGGLEWKPFDPVTLALDAAYGRAAYTDSMDQEGWYAVGKAAYALSFGEPALMAWFASGDKGHRPMNSGQIPIIYGDFDGTSTYFDAAWGLTGGHRCAFGGTWGVSAQLNGVSFLSDLSHDFSVTYIGGTNSKLNGAYGDSRYDYLTTDDSAVEFNVLSTYQIYKNLTSALELAYIIEDFDTNTSHGRSGSYDDDWRVALHFEYKF